MLLNIFIGNEIKTKIMLNFYENQFSALRSEGNPLPKVRIIDSEGNCTLWLHMTIECINEMLKYLEKEKLKRMEVENLIIN
jgi:hypothetical protein